MTTLLFGSERGTESTRPMPIHAPASRVPAGEDQVAVAATEVMPMREQPTAPAATPLWDSAQPSIVPQVKARPFPALPAMMTGLLSTAGVWLGLALFVIAVAYPLSDLTRAVLTLVGTSMIAVAIAFTMSSRPEYA